MKEISILNSTEEFNHFKAAILSADWQIPFQFLSDLTQTEISMLIINNLYGEIRSKIQFENFDYYIEKLEIKEKDKNFDYEDFVQRKIDPNEMEKSRLFR